MQKTEFKLHGLCCAGCALQIENEIKRLGEVESATVELVSKTVTVSIPDDYSGDIEAQIKKIAAAVDPGVTVKRTADNIHFLQPDQQEHTSEIIKIAVSAVLFTAALFPLSAHTKALLFALSYLAAGADVILKAVKSIFKGNVFSEFFLMSVASAGAFLIGEYAEAAAVMLFYSLGELFQDLAVARSRKSIKALLSVMPDYANLKCGNDEKRVPPSEVSKDDIIIIKPGEKVPLDAVITEGSSFVDTSALTGESTSRRVSPGDEVLSGFINRGGLLCARVTKIHTESAAYKILDMVENAAGKKAPTEHFISKFARYYTPAVVFSAALVAVIPPLIIKSLSFSECLYNALVFLVVSCPCALVISVPLSFFGGISAASRCGILVKGGNYLEALKDVDTVVFDKTGTLTLASFSVTQINSYGDLTKEDVLKYAAYAESYSNHPIAASIIKAYDGETDKSLIASYGEIEGMGITACIDGKNVLAGSKKLMKLHKIDFPDEEITGTAVYIAVNGSPAGSIIISDTVKPGAFNAVSLLKGLGVSETIMLTGDSKKIGDEVAHQLGIDKVYAELLPDEKVEMLEKIKQNASGKVIFAGDGINDAPVLAYADIGVSMGGMGSDAAIEAADVVIMNDEPSKITDVIKIARKTGKIVAGNIAFALGVKFLILALSLLGAASMWSAVFADVGVTILAVLNSMRILKIKL